MTKNLDVIGDSGLLVDAGGEKRFVVLNSGLGDKGKPHQDEEDNAEQAFHVMDSSYHRVDCNDYQIYTLRWVYDTLGETK